jgi:hypothetical protein
MTDSKDAGWALTTKWHQVSALSTERALCGSPIPASAVRGTAAEVAEHGAATRTCVCGSCEQVAHPAPSHRTLIPDAVERLTPEQLSVYEKRQDEQLRRERLRAAEERDSRGRPAVKSPRTVSGGLPGLGKRR